MYRNTLVWTLKSPKGKRKPSANALLKHERPERLDWQRKKRHGGPRKPQRQGSERRHRSEAGAEGVVGERPVPEGLEEPVRLSVQSETSVQTAR